MTDDRLEIAPELVHRLVAGQFPRWSHLPVRRVAEEGWDNRTFRLGDHMKVRMPSAARYAAQPAKEHRWLPRLAPHLPRAIPAALALGAPAADYPWPWSVQNWMDGEPASRANVRDEGAFAADLADFLHALQRIPAGDGPPAGGHSFFRGGPLAVYDAETRACLAALEASDRANAAEVWQAALAATWRGPPVWVHGDIAAGNLLVRDGRLHAVIDFGSSAVGDPACDLVIAWTFLTEPGREAFAATITADEDAWARARAWALWKALLTLATGGTASPGHVPPREVIARVVADHRRAR